MNARLRLFSLLGLALCLSPIACVSGAKVRAQADVLQAELERARRSGARRCAPRELATAEANVEFALGELSQGASSRASEHIRIADKATRDALSKSKGCGPRQVVVKEPEQKVIVRIEETDKDGDGVLDKDDQCPTDPEDADGFQDEDGCPDLDNDGDGVLDGQDACPMVPGAAANNGCPDQDKDGDGVSDSVDRCVDQPEDKDEYQDEDGCPELDNDSDGILDSADKCPNQAGPLQNLGCPITDRDGDGINDDGDKCPDEPEDKDGFEDEDGCPDLDNDKDGLADAQDSCPAEAGPPENKGCPDADKDGDTVVDRLDECPDQAGVVEEKGCPKKYKLVEVKKDKIEIRQQINFASGSARITGRSSQEVLDEVALALRDNPQIQKIRIEGHTDSQGSDASNLRLSQNRADAVMAQLIKRGVDPARLTSIGYGESTPIASNATAKGRAENRRTEFNIVDQ